MVVKSTISSNFIANFVFKTILKKYERALLGNKDNKAVFTCNKEGGVTDDLAKV